MTNLKTSFSIVYTTYPRIILLCSSYVWLCLFFTWCPRHIYFSTRSFMQVQRVWGCWDPCLSSFGFKSTFCYICCSYCNVFLASLKLSIINTVSLKMIYYMGLLYIHDLFTCGQYYLMSRLIVSLEILSCWILLIEFSVFC